MEKIKIFVDSCCDFTLEDVKKYGVGFLPLYTILGEKITPNNPISGDNEIKTFYDDMRKGAFFKSSQINLAETIEKFEKAAKDDYNILFISFSSAISGTYNVGVRAKEMLAEQYPNIRIEIFDSKTASTGLDLFVTLICEKLLEGYDMDKLLKYCKKVFSYQITDFAIEDVNILKRGGRLTATKALIAKYLNLKPCLYINKEGALIPFKAARGSNNALAALSDRFEKAYSFDTKGIDNRIYIGHADNVITAEKLKQLLIKRFKIDPQLITLVYVGKVIGCHVGPNMIALAYFSKEKKTL